MIIIMMMMIHGMDGITAFCSQLDIACQAVDSCDKANPSDGA
jgi:hypothetical protein